METSDLYVLRFPDGSYAKGRHRYTTERTRDLGQARIFNRRADAAQSTGTYGINKGAEVVPVVVSIKNQEDLTYAFANEEDPKGTVRVWCEHRGGDVYHVINGAWTMVLGEDPAERAVLVWSGVVPPDHARDYNTAIAWIEAQIKE